MEQGMIVPEQEVQLGKDATSIEAQAASLTIENDSDYTAAAEMLKSIKALLKRIGEYWDEPISAAYQAHKMLTAKRKQMEDGPKKGETILKKKMADYQQEQERKRREEEERMRQLIREEQERKLAEAIKAEQCGDHDAVEYAMTEAEVLDSMSVNVEMAKPKVSGVLSTKTWEIVGIDPKLVPVEIAGVEIRPVDRAAILRLIKATKGQIAIPGVKYKETVSVSVRAS